MRYRFVKEIYVLYELEGRIKPYGLSQYKGMVVIEHAYVSRRFKNEFFTTCKWGKYIVYNEPRSFVLSGICLSSLIVRNCGIIEQGTYLVVVYTIYRQQ